MVLAMAQANVTFPLLADGLSLLIIPFSLAGGIAASASTYYWFARSRSRLPAGAKDAREPDFRGDARSKDVMSQLIGAGEEGV